jgi:hypothetical protein
MSIRGCAVSAGQETHADALLRGEVDAGSATTSRPRAASRIEVRPPVAGFEVARDGDRMVATVPTGMSGTRVAWITVSEPDGASGEVCLVARVSGAVR